MRTDDTLWVLPDRYRFGTPCGALWSPDGVLVLDWYSSDHLRSTSHPHAASEHNSRDGSTLDTGRQPGISTGARSVSGIRSMLSLEGYPVDPAIRSQSIAAKANGDRNTPAGCILLVFTCTDSVKTKALRPPDLDAEPQSSVQRQGDTV